MTAIFVLTLVIIGVSWIGNIIGTIIHLDNCSRNDEGLYVAVLFFKTIFAALMVVFVCILYANIS